MKLCQIYNFASHYRSAIYTLISKTFDTDFVFGNKADDIKKMDYSLLDANVSEVKTLTFCGFTFQQGILSLLRKQYDSYILTGETRCISTWLFLIFSRFYSDKKIYLWSHGWYGKETFIERLIKKLLFKLPNGGIFLYGNYAKQLMIKEGFNKDKLFVIHNSLDYEKHLVLRSSISSSNIYQEHFKNEYPNLIFIGRLTQVKKLDMIIKSMAQNKQSHHEYNLTLIGGGEETETLKNLTSELGLEDNVWFYGACYDEKKIAELIYNADLCVSPGNVGLTAIHTLTFGTPVITHNNFALQMPEFEAITEGKTGTFFEYGSIDSLAESINDWFEKNNGKREEIRTHCFKEIDTSWTPQYQIDVLKTVLHKNK